MDFQERIQDIQTEINSLRDRLSETDDKLFQFHDEIVNQDVVSEEDLREALMFWSTVSVPTCLKIWGEAFMRDILKKYSLFEFVNKYKEYKQKDEEDKEIMVGDEVITIYEPIKKVVVNVGDLEAILINSNGVSVCDKRDLKKTGKHYDIQSILNQLKESD